MKVWLVTAFEPIPSDGVRPMRFMGIADELLKKGNDVTFWTGSFSAFNGKQRFEKDTYSEISSTYHQVVLKSESYFNKKSFSRFKAHKHLANRFRDEMPKADKPDLIFIS